MKTIVTLFLFATLILADNPRVFSAIGDTVYNNADAIEKLKDIDSFLHNNSKIDSYVNDVKKTKEDGFLLESGEKSIDKGSYLKKLRELIKTNDYFIKEVDVNFKRSMESQDTALFTQIINSELLDIHANRKDILKYYSSHSDEIEKEGVIEKLLEEDLILKKDIEAKNLTYKQIQAAKIKRIKDSAKAKEKAMIKALELEAMQKKKEILINQKKELSNY